MADEDADEEWEEDVCLIVGKLVRYIHSSHIAQRH